jgi:6-pyruvoyltetrahydropterin/6-carboxytetrahydropterin synthase
LPDPVRLTRAIEFSTSLRYWRGDLGEQENRALFGRQAEQHGHNYRLEVTLVGEPDPVTGMVIDLKELKDLLEREIMSRFDHKDLNRDTPFFEKDPPTPENFARVVHRILKRALPPGLLDAVRLYQDPDHWVDVRDPEPAG